MLFLTPTSRIVGRNRVRLRLILKGQAHRQILLIDHLICESWRMLDYGMCMPGWSTKGSCDGYQASRGTSYVDFKCIPDLASPKL